jgi:hypothetical protein
MNCLITTQSTQQFHRENYHIFVTIISFFLTTCFGQRRPSSGLQVPKSTKSLSLIITKIIKIVVTVIW